MFSKALILVFLGVSLTLASATKNEAKSPRAKDDKDLLVTAFLSNKLTEKWQSTKSTANAVLDRLNKNYDQVLDEARKQSGQAKEMSQEQYNQLKRDYEELQKLANADLEQQTKIWIGRLKQAIFQGNMSLQQGLEQIKVWSDEADKGIHGQVDKWQMELDNWMANVEAALK